MMPFLVATLPSVPLSWYLILAFALVTLGLLGLLVHRSALAVALASVVVLNGINLTLVAFARFRADDQGQLFPLFMMAAIAIYLAVGIAQTTRSARLTPPTPEHAPAAEDSR